MADAIIGLVSSIFDCLKSSSCLGQPLQEEYNYFTKRKENLETLKREMEDLEQKRHEVDRQAKDKVVSKPYRTSDWLQKAEECCKNETDDLSFGIRDDCCGSPDYYWSQYKAGKKVAERMEKVKALNVEGENLFRIYARDFVVGYMQESTKLVSKETASVVEEIKQYLAGNEVGTICVYGMAGSGKTAVVKEVNNHILEEYKYCALEGSNNGNENVIKDHFDKVIWLTVENSGSAETSIDILQKDIAKELQIDRNIGSRADTLATALRKKRFLIVLDDMWRDLSLEEIGIPSPTEENRCKVIIISRSLPVCRENRIDKMVEIKLLSDTMSQKLFEHKAGIKLSEIRGDNSTPTMLKEMIDECNGLPSTIIFLAEALREELNSSDDSVDVDTRWKKAVTSLKESSDKLESLNKKAFARLKRSYNMLKKESQQCLLYCALYPSGHCIEKKELVEYWFWEGLLGGKESNRQLIEDMPQATEILEELIGAYLLEKVSEEGSSKEYIKMSNLVRQMALHITKTSPQFFVEIGDKHRTEFPLQVKWVKVERASLMRSQLEVLAGEPKCHKLSTLLLQHNPINVHLHESFFNSMPNLKLLDLSHTKILSLPKSAFSSMTKLRALLLKNCRNLTSLPSLANSKKLLVLDLSDTPITQLPDGMEELTNLIRLNLSRTNVGEFQAELVRALRDLEELLMITGSSSFWGSTYGTSIEELGALRHLSILHINFASAQAYNRYFNLQRRHSLSKFKICVGGPCKEMLPENSVVFIRSNFLVKGKPVSLPKDTCELRVMHNKDLPCLQLTYLKNLKAISISGCERLVYLFKIDDLCNLPNIEKILVEKCQKMEALIESKEYADSFLQVQVTLRLKHLKVISISDCENLVYLFGIEMYFPNLLKISVKQCRRMEVVIKAREPNVWPAVLPGLQELELVHLEELKSIYDGEIKCNNYRQIIWNCPALKMPFIASLPDEELFPKPSFNAERANRLKRRHSFDGTGGLLQSTQLTPPNGDSILPAMDVGGNTVVKTVHNVFATLISFAMLQKLVNPSPSGSR